MPSQRGGVRVPWKVISVELQERLATTVAEKNARLAVILAEKDSEIQVLKARLVAAEGDKEGCL